MEDPRQILISLQQLKARNQQLSREINNRIKLESKLRSSYEYYKTITSMYPVGIFHIDKYGKCSYLNNRCCEILDLSFDEAKGDGWIKAIHHDDYLRIIQELAVTDALHKEFKLEYRLIHKNGDIRWVHCEIVSQYGAKGELLTRIGTATDITALREAETKIREHQTKLAHFTRLNVIGELATGIAHQLNQPLSAIVHYTGGVLERLKDEQIPSEVIDVIQRIMLQAEHAGAIIHDFKNFLKKGELKKCQTNINLLIKHVIKLIEPDLAETKIDLQLELDTKLADVLIDKLQIEQVVLNIISNAIDAIKEQKPVDPKIVITSKYYSKNSVKIIISNSGSRILANMIEQIFEPFITTKEEGMGMGLAIASTIMQSHGGRIYIDHNYTDGASFVLLLPIDGDPSKCSLLK